MKCNVSLVWIGFYAGDVDGGGGEGGEGEGEAAHPVLHSELEKRAVLTCEV